jgi:hypothetical protein|tara:strand:+ start:1179 stop:1367 length:189 start_codon:yes stop_codon:yes gene_type:complete
MTNIETIYLFVFIFSTILLVRTTLKFIISLLQTKPEKMVLSNREILFNGLSLSYLITYLIQV